MKSPRFTVRRLMVAVAVVAAVLGLWSWVERRAEGFRDRAIGHGWMWVSFDTSTSPAAASKAAWHRALWLKYGEAARRPWLPVWPDPPEPE